MPEPETPETRSSLLVRTAIASRDLARGGFAMTRKVVRDEWFDRAKAQEDLTDDQIWRRYQFRHIAAFVTIPAVVLGTASLAAAYGTGLLSSEEAPTCTPQVVPAPPAKSVTISVQNASGQNGAGGEAAKNLERRGFTITETSNAPRDLYVKAPVRIFHGPAGRDHALYAAQSVEGAQVESDGRKGVSLTFVLGTEFDGMKAAPPPKPPAQKSYKVNVYNATWRPGLATKTMTELKARGFAPGKQGNDKMFMPDEFEVIRFGADGELAAKQVARHFKDAKLMKVDRDGTDVDVIITNKFVGVTPEAELEPVPVPPKEKPATVSRPCVPKS